MPLGAIVSQLRTCPLLSTSEIQNAGTAGARSPLGTARGRPWARTGRRERRGGCLLPATGPRTSACSKGRGCTRVGDCGWLCIPAARGWRQEHPPCSPAVPVAAGASFLEARPRLRASGPPPSLAVPGLDPQPRFCSVSPGLCPPSFCSSDPFNSCMINSPHELSCACGSYRRFVFPGGTVARSDGKHFRSETWGSVIRTAAAGRRQPPPGPRPPGASFLQLGDPVTALALLGESLGQWECRRDVARVTHT